MQVTTSENLSLLDDYVLERCLSPKYWNKVSKLFRAYNKSDKGDKFAVAIFNPDTDTSSDAQNEKFKKHCELHKNLNHYNVVKVIGLEITDKWVENGQVIGKNKLSCKLEYNTKGRLIDYLSVNKDLGRLPEPIVRYYIKQLVEGMKFIQSNFKDVERRDLKLENLFLGRDYELLISNFGRGSNGDVDTLHEKLGTKKCHPPETITNINDRYDAKAVDSFMVGVVLFYLITGEYPFVINASKEDSCYVHIIDEKPHDFWYMQGKRFKSNPVNFSNDLKELLESLFAVIPKNRSTMTQVDKHAWLKEPIASVQEVKTEMRGRYNFQRTKKKQESDGLSNAPPRPDESYNQSSGYGCNRGACIDEDSIVCNLAYESAEITATIKAIQFENEVPVYTNEESNFFYSHFSALSPVELLKAASVVTNNINENRGVTIMADSFEVD